MGNVDDTSWGGEIGIDRMKWIDQLFGLPIEESPVEKVIEQLPKSEEVDKVYQARWVWYHTILAVEILCTNILLVAILVVLSLK